MAERDLGPWLKLYADIVDRKAHYDDRQFRAFIELLAMAERLKGLLPPQRALAARFGAEVIDFLVAEGDLVTTDDGMTPAHWEKYQAHDRTAAERQRRHRELVRAGNRDSTVTSRVTVTKVPSASASASDVDTTNEEERPSASDFAPTPQVDHTQDALDSYWLVAGRYPTGRVKHWLEDLIDKYGDRAVSRNLGVAAAQGGPDRLLSRAADLLARDAAKAEQAERTRAEEEKRASRRRGPATLAPISDEDYDAVLASVTGDTDASVRTTH